MADETPEPMPLAALGVLGKMEHEADLPMAYIPHIPTGPSFRDMIERAVGWSRR